MPVIPLPKTTSERIFGEGRTSPTVFDSKTEQVAKKVMRVLGMDDPPDPVSAGADFANPLGIPGFGGVVRLGRNIAGAGLQELRLSTGEMVRAVRELLEHGRFRAFHGTPDRVTRPLSRRPFHVGTIDAAIDRLRNISRPIQSATGEFETIPGVSLENAQIVPVDVSFRGGLRGSSALHDLTRPVMGRPTAPLTDEVANTVGDIVEAASRDLGSRAGWVQRPQISKLHAYAPLSRRIEEPVNQSIDEINRGNTEAILYRNAVEDRGSLSMSILDPVSTDVRIGNPLDVEELFRQQELIGLPSRGSSSRDPLWKFKGR